MSMAQNNKGKISKSKGGIINLIKNLSDKIQQLENTNKIQQLENNKNLLQFLKQLENNNNLNKNLEKKIIELEQKILSMELQNRIKPVLIHKQNQNVGRGQNIKNLERKLIDLEKKILTKKSNRENKVLNNVINEDLNKIKLKLEKHEDLIKKFIFN